MTRFAEGTSVPVQRSIAQIQHNVRRFGATEFGYLETARQARVGFAIDGYRVELAIELPQLKDFALTRTGLQRSANQQADQCAQETRRKWRALAFVVKSLCLAVDDKVLSFEEAFLAHIVLGGGQTVGHTLLPSLQEARDQGRLPSSLGIDRTGRLLPAPAKGGE